MGTQPPSPKRGGAWGQSPQFSAHVYCGQMAGWIKMALGMEVGLGPVHIMIDGDTAPLPKKGAEPPNFRPIFIVAKWLHESRCHLDPANTRKRAHPPLPNFVACLLWPSGWMDEDTAWYSSWPRPRPHCTRRGTRSREKGTAAPLSFQPMSIVATVTHLSYC